MAEALFTSYARFNNHKQVLKKVIDELVHEVASQLGRNDVAGLSFFDTDSVDLGQTWEQRIASAINEASVLLCMMSPTYYNRPHCAKEFEVFRRRTLNRDHPELTVHIIPLLWEVSPSLPIPAVLSQYQWMNNRLPPAYRQGGLLKLKQLRKADYVRALGTIAQAIVDSMNATPPLEPLPSTPRFEELPNSFHNPSDSDFCVSVVIPHPSGANCNIDNKSAVPTPAHHAIDAACAQTGTGWRDVAADANLVMATSEAGSVVVLVPPDVSASGKLAIEALDGQWHCIRPLDSAFPVHCPGQTVTYPPGSLSGLQRAAENLFADLRLRHLKGFPAKRITDAALEARAASDGHGNLQSLPRISGSGSAR